MDVDSIGQGALVVLRRTLVLLLESAARVDWRGQNSLDRGIATRCFTL
jgi:hypothetical protein